MPAHLGLTRLSRGAVVLAGVLAISAAQVSGVNVDNFSFEDPDLGDGVDNGALAQSAPDWIEQGPGAGSAGIQDGANGGYAGSTGNPGATSLPGTAHGHQFGWINVNAGQSASFTSQNVITSAQLGNTYTLTVALGDRLDINPGQATIELISATTLQVASTASTSAYTNGSFTDLITVYTPVLLDPALTEGLKIRLTHTNISGNQEQLSFDNVRLDVVPEPASMTVLGLAGLAGMVRRRRPWG